MATSYNAQIDNEHGRHCIQFETDSYELFKFVEKACQKAVDNADKAALDKRQTIGYLRERG